VVLGMLPALANADNIPYHQPRRILHHQHTSHAAVWLRRPMCLAYRILPMQQAKHVLQFVHKQPIPRKGVTTLSLL
jgi:hypothetical protein